MIGLLPSLNRYWRRDPPGYQVGTTLNRLTANLQPYACERVAVNQLRLTLPQGPVIEVAEQVQSLFLAHIVTHRFRLQGNARFTEPLVLNIITGGWLRRKGVIYRTKAKHEGARQLIATLQQYPQIGDTLAKLDFRHATLTITEGRWQLDIEHFAASEVVSRLPASRRYLRLEAEQRRLLLSSFLMVSQLMEKCDE
ncbi:TPA: DUF3156 family protein [Serratia fonticola]|uniref:DUF3156 family protein n=1 Tax=Serratia TaxID=613 RepID=UPI000EF5367C|nr:MULTISPECIES: DUF3156 family protein [Serratia]AYM93361.1 DUF3156 family protein [Serratia sp. 3ACOL1]NTY85390.1 DUF3156 family protein [Serratia fonticola]NTZ11139.1 DUF3156 family protein [Serratia fonticola]CAI0762378.1 Protein of uncharacterised function (DUF3156) [Serratia fonticola]CAI1997149.1 Protein of uncharacterised function (DUF3156) [Serratia fonticola]